MNSILEIGDEVTFGDSLVQGYVKGTVYAIMVGGYYSINVRLNNGIVRNIKVHKNELTLVLKKTDSLISKKSDPPVPLDFFGNSMDVIVEDISAVSEEKLKEFPNGLVLEKKSCDICPDCSAPWTETKFETNVWLDCTKCNKTKEEILKHHDKTNV